MNSRKPIGLRASILLVAAFATSCVVIEQASSADQLKASDERQATVQFRLLDVPSGELVTATAQSLRE